MSIESKLNYLMSTKNQIKEAIVEKGVEVLDSDTFRSYANKIQSIEKGGSSSTGEWQLESDWWNIEEIINNDTESYTQKIICLLSDELDDKATVNQVKRWNKVQAIRRTNNRM